MLEKTIIEGGHFNPKTFPQMKQGQLYTNDEKSVNCVAEQHTKMLAIISDNMNESTETVRSLTKQ
jgi:hypothetical protein